MISRHRRPRLPRASSIVERADHDQPASPVPALAYPPVPDRPPPAPPEGWRIVPHATPGVTAYETSVVIDPAAQPLSEGPGTRDFCGLNASEFHGFPAETLDIGDVSFGVFWTADGLNHKLTYRFLYRPEGWQGSDPASRRPIVDYRVLPGLSWRDEG